MSEPEQAEADQDSDDNEKENEPARALKRTGKRKGGASKKPVAAALSQVSATMPMLPLRVLHAEKKYSLLN